LQLCAYSEAHNELHGTKIRKGVILMCVKPDLNEQMEIIKPPEYQEFVLEGAEFDRYKNSLSNLIFTDYLEFQNGTYEIIAVHPIGQLVDTFTAVKVIIKKTMNFMFQLQIL
jgi:hypothetical protein